MDLDWTSVIALIFGFSTTVLGGILLYLKYLIARQDSNAMKSLEHAMIHLREDTSHPSIPHIANALDVFKRRGSRSD